MREIKFEYGFKSINGIIKKTYSLSQIPFITQLCDVWDNLPIEYVRESTGLTDKNGVDVFESDIIEYKGAKGVVYYDNDIAMFMVRFEYLRSNYSFDSVDEEFEVIGNIHEHPNLLK